MTLTIDPDLLEAEQARARRVLGEAAQRDDRQGRLARLGLATLGIDPWVAEEFARGSTMPEILEAVMVRAAAMVGTQIVNAGISGNARVVLAAKLGSMARAMADNIDEVGPGPAPSDFN